MVPELHSRPVRRVLRAPGLCTIGRTGVFVSCIMITILSATVLLILVMDPLGNVPLFLVALKDVAPGRQRRVVARELCIALVVMVMFLFCGRFVLDLFQITQHALSIAGGIILFLIAVRMIFPSTGGLFGDSPGGEPFIVPLAIPLVAGPSTLITLTLLVSREPERWPGFLLALILAWLISVVVLLASNLLSRLLTEKGLIALERLMGMILTAVAVQMLMTGVGEAIVQFRQVNPG